MQIGYLGKDKLTTPEAILERLGNPQLIAVDVETISLQDRTPIGLTIAPSPDEAVYFPLYPETSSYLPLHLLQDPAVTKIFHNALFDLDALYRLELDTSNIIDTMIIAHLLGLPSDLPTFSGVDIEKLKLSRSNTTLDLPIEDVVVKACKDAKATFLAYEKYYQEVDKQYLQVEMELIPLLVKMSRRGIKLDQQIRAELEAKLTEEHDSYLAMAELEGFNPSSPQQVGFTLVARGEWLPPTKKFKQYITDERTLKKLDDPLAALTLNYRKVHYLLSHYIKPWEDCQRAYTRFHLDAATGRVSSIDRNLQNIPKGRMRNMFLPDNDVFTDLDFSQIELRVLAYLSQDDLMLSSFDLGLDIHQMTADFLRVSRYLAKTINFAITYGATAMTVADEAGVSLQVAKELLKQWFSQYTGAARWIAERQEEALATYRVKTMFGRTIPLPTDDRPDETARKCINYPVQGSAAEIAKRALLKCKHLPVVLMVHDELLFDGMVDIPDLSHIVPFETPYTVKILSRWE